MIRQNRIKTILTLAAVAMAIFVTSANAAMILVHGKNATASAGSDGAILARLQSLYGASNVTYMQGSAAAADGSSAAGYDAVIISSTIPSSDCRGKYEDATQAVMTWEAALAKDDTGDFQMFQTHYSGSGHTQIDIVDPTHPLAAGLSGTVTVTSAPDMMQYGRDGLGGGVDLVASTTGGDHAILAADVGDALLGHGSPGNPSEAAGRRVFFFLNDSTFANLTPDGLKLFDAAVAYLVDLNIPSVNAGDDMITWSGQPVQLDPNFAEGYTPNSFTWSADDDTGVVFDPNEFVEAPIVTITKDTDNPSPVKLTLAVTDGTDAYENSMTIDVYDDSCLAAKAVGPVELDPTDIDENCITNFKDFAVMATTWLDDYTLTGPVVK